MRPRGVSWVPLVVLSAVLPAAAGPFLPDPLTVTAASEVRSAYQTRGLIVEDRPVLLTPVTLRYATPTAGTFGLWTRWISSLTNRKEVQHSPWAYERDWAVGWRYDWVLADGIVLRSDLDVVWLTYWNYRAPYRGERDHTTAEGRWRQELRTPLATPYVLMRRGMAPVDTFYIQAGVWREFPLAGSVSLTPAIFAEFGNTGLFNLRYGNRTDGHTWRGGLQALNARFDITWRLNEHVSLVAGVHEFVTVNEPVRRALKAKTSRWSRRDLTIFSVGAKFTF